MKVTETVTKRLWGERFLSMTGPDISALPADPNNP